MITPSVLKNRIMSPSVKWRMSSTFFGTVILLFVVISAVAKTFISGPYPGWVEEVHQPIGPNHHY